MNSDILTYFFRSAICLAIFYSLYWFILRKERTFSFNRYYLLASVVLSYILPLIDFSGLFSRETAATLPGTIVQNLIVPDSIAPVIIDWNSELVQQSKFNVLDYVFYIYIFIAAILFIQMITGMIKLFLIWKRGSGHKTGDYTIVYTKDNIAPFSFFRFVFLNKDNIDNNNVAQIIAHERIHIHQHHSLDTLFINIITIIQWFNPFIWLVKRALKETHEFLADEKVIAQGFDSATYSELLIKQIAGAKAMDFANCFNHLLIKKRLIMLKKLKPGKLASLKTMLILPLALLLVISFNIQGQDKSNKKVAFMGLAPKMYLTEAQREARQDSIMNLKSPSFMDMDSQAMIIATRNVVLPKEEKDDNGYCYLLGTALDFTTGKFEVNAYKEKTTKDGKLVKNAKLIPVKIINSEELKSKLPVLPEGELKKMQSKRTNAADNKGHFSMSSFSSIKDFKGNTEYWKTHN